MHRAAMVVCENDHKLLTWLYDFNNYTLEEELENCFECGKPVKVVEFDEIADPEILIAIAENELEDANYHSISSLPGEIYTELMKLLPQTIARAIAKAFMNI